MRILGFHPNTGTTRGTVALKLVVDPVARVQLWTDKTAAELALVRLEKELAVVNAQLARCERRF